MKAEVLVPADADNGIAHWSLFSIFILEVYGELFLDSKKSCEPGRLSSIGLRECKAKIQLLQRVPEGQEIF